MASDHLTATMEGLINSLRNDNTLQDSLTNVFPYFAQYDRGYYVEPRKLTIQVTIGDSGTEEPLHNETTGTDILPTDFILVCDTQIPEDSEAFISEHDNSLLDLEYKVLRALQSTEWWGTTSEMYGWVVDSIERDVPVLDADGLQDFEIRRFIITLTVDVILDRDETNGPAR